MINKNVREKNDVHLSQKSDVSNDKENDREYRKVLKELGFEKPEDEPLTTQELSQIFIHMQEGLFVGS